MVNGRRRAACRFLRTGLHVLTAAAPTFRDRTGTATPAVILPRKSWPPRPRARGWTSSNCHGAVTSPCPYGAVGVGRYAGVTAGNARRACTGRAWRLWRSLGAFDRGRAAVARAKDQIKTVIACVLARAGERRSPISVPTSAVRALPRGCARRRASGTAAAVTERTVGAPVLFGPIGRLPASRQTNVRLRDGDGPALAHREADCVRAGARLAEVVAHMVARCFALMSFRLVTIEKAGAPSRI